VLHLLEKNLGFTPEEITRLQLVQQPTNSTTTFVRNRHDGCWMDRMADAVAIIVVDALRFDFALEHLPKSVGSRITQRSLEGGVDTTTAANTRRLGSKSKLVKFVADPPTVTMQRLKGLTTGGLPAFADISNSFGGATVDEDTWILHHSPPLTHEIWTRLIMDAYNTYLDFLITLDHTIRTKKY